MRSYVILIVRNFQESQRSKPFQAKVKGESQFYAEVKSQGKILAFTTVVGGSMEECEVTPPCKKPSTI